MADLYQAIIFDACGTLLSAGDGSIRAAQRLPGWTGVKAKEAVEIENLLELETIIG